MPDTASLPRTAADSPRSSRRARLGVLAICCMSVFVVSLDNTIVNVALPSIRRELGASVSQLQWTVDAYTVVLGALLVLSGSIAASIGRARVFCFGLVLFTAGSVLCSAAPTASWLIAFRAVQALGGSMLNPAAMSIIRNTFTHERARPQALGVWAGVVGLSMALGPLLGGGLIAVAGWPAIFWVNAPVGLLAVVLVHRFVPESRAPTPRRVDPVGQVLVIVALGSLTYAIIESGSAGVVSARTLSTAAVAVAALVTFVVYERRRADPLIDPRFFRSIPFSGATLIAIAAFTALGGFLFITNLYLQGDRGLSAVHAGLYTLPMAVTAFVAAPLSGRLVGKRGARLPPVLGGAGLAISSLLLTGLTPTTATGWLLIAYLVFGLGFGMVNPPITNTAVSGMPAAQAGVAAAIAWTSRLVGISLGVAIIGAIVAAGHSGTSFAQASRPGWWVTSACGLIVLALGIASTTRPALAPAQVQARLAPA